jgi:hypothetical protein
MKARRRKKRRAFRTIELEEDAARLGPFPRRRVPYDDITFIAAGTHRGWLGHDDSSEAHPLSVETRSGRVMTLQLRHSDADKALRALKARSPNAAAIDSEGHEHLPASGGAQAIIAARERLAATWAPLVWLSFAGGIVLVPLCGWGVLKCHARRGVGPRRGGTRDRHVWRVGVRHGVVEGAEADARPSRPRATGAGRAPRERPATGSLVLFYRE